jgi:hypothetical protein
MAVAAVTVIIVMAAAAVAVYRVPRILRVFPLYREFSSPGEFPRPGRSLGIWRIPQVRNDSSDPLEILTSC